MTLVWKMVRGKETPWVIVAPSAALRIARQWRERDAGKAEKADSDEGMGLYAWRRFERDEVIGTYGGVEYGPFDANDEEAIAQAHQSLPEGRRDKVRELAREQALPR